MGAFVHACEGEMLCESVNPKIPYFNAPIYLENKVNWMARRNVSVWKANVDLDCHWQSRRDTRTHQPSLLHNKTARGYRGYIFQDRGQILHRR